MSYTEGIIRVLSERYGKNVYFAQDYGEPGYSKDLPDAPIIFTSMNDIPSYLERAIEKRFNFEWHDEWVVNHETGKAYRSSGDSYFWTKYYVQTEDGEIIGGDEIEEDEDQQDWYINEYLLNNPNNICAFKINLKEHGFVKCNEDEYEAGWHKHQTDNPHKILEQAQKTWPDHDFLFGNLESSQFFVKFNLYRRPVKEDND